MTDDERLVISKEVCDSLEALNEWFMHDQSEPRQPGDLDSEQIMELWKCSEETCRQRMNRAVKEGKFKAVKAWDIVQHKKIKVWRKV